MKRADIKSIAQAVLLERISPIDYRRIVESIQHKIDLPNWQKQEILSNFGLPLLSSRCTEKQFKNIIKVVKERIQLDEAVKKIYKAVPIGYKIYNPVEEYYEDDNDEDDEY